MGYEVGDRVWVKQSDAPEMRVEVTEVSETHLRVLTREGRSFWVERRRCSFRPRFQ